MEPVPKVPTVSVCLPVFNGARFLARVFSCLRDQTFRDFEVVVVDDGSTDGSAEEARRLLVEHGFVGHVVRTENRGSARARDAACEAARAAFIATLDCDDWWSPRYLEDMLAVLGTRTGIDLVYCDFLELFSDGRDILKSDVATWVDTSQADSHGDVHVFPRGAFFKMLLRGQVLFPSCTVYRKTLYQQVGGYAAQLSWLPTSLDWFFGLRAARVGTVAFLKQPLLRKYVRADSVSNASFSRTISSSVRILKAFLDDPTLQPEERRSARSRGAIISYSCAYESWVTHESQVEALKWVFTSLGFEWSWRATMLATKLLIPRGLIERLRPSPRRGEPGGSRDRGSRAPARGASMRRFG